jgi:hypothetical protein
METLIRGGVTGLWYVWNGAHTVTIRHEPEGEEFGCYTLGYDARRTWTFQPPLARLSGPSYDGFVASVEQHEAECRYTFVIVASAVAADAIVKGIGLASSASL